MKQKGILVVDFYTEAPEKAAVIAARVKEAGVYAETIPWHQLMTALPQMQLESVTGRGPGIPQALIFSGSRHGVYEPDHPRVPAELFDMGFPILGICYGMQLMAAVLGGQVEKRNCGEEGETPLQLLAAAQKDAADPNGAAGSRLLAGIPAETDCYMHHHDFVTVVPPGFVVTSRTAECPIASFESPRRKLYGVQFHPEVRGTAEEKRLLSNFIYTIAECWPNL